MYYDIVKRKVIIFFIFFKILYWILLWIYFFFIILMMTMTRYFNKSHGNFNLPPLDLTLIESPVLQSKNTWKYLSFIFDKKLAFYQHINFYSNKAISTIKCIKILEYCKNIYYIDFAFFPLCYTDFNSGFTTMLSCYIT